MIIQGIERTKTSIAEHIRSKIVPKYTKFNAPLSGNDLNFMLSVFLNHDGWEEKKGAGVKNIWCKPDYGGKSYCFYIERIDGTMIDISWRTCIYERTDHYYDSAAARAEIEYQIEDFRKSQVGSDGQHVDHFPIAFSILWSFFKLDWGPQKDFSVYHDGKKNFFNDKNMSSAWKDYHLKNAKLRLSDPIENIKRGNGIDDDKCPCGGEPVKQEKIMVDGRRCWQIRCSSCDTWIRSIKKTDFLSK